MGLVFDISQKSYPWEWLIYPFSMVVVFLTIIVSSHLMHSTKTSKNKVLNFRYFSYFGLIFCLTIGLVGFVITYEKFALYQSAIQQGDASVIEGYVENFAPKTSLSRGSSESFSVDGVVFSYSGSEFEPGFNQTKVQGGPIENGLHVRIHHIENTILRLEILH